MFIIIPTTYAPYIKSSCYKAALMANLLFFFSHVFLHPLSLFSFFAAVMVALRASICILRFPIFVFLLGESGLCLCLVLEEVCALF